MGTHLLDRLFTPHAIAVFGASDRADSVGGRVFRNILDGGFAGPVYPINPKRATVAGHKCYAALEAIGQPVDFAAIATPAAAVPGVLRDCGEHGVRAAVVYSAGFAESHDQQEGQALQRALLAEAGRYGMQVLGPNCLGLIRPAIKLNATFSRNNAASGALALVSQSGALCTAILDWAVVHRVGFSAVVSLGEAASLDFGDVLDFFALDAHTEGILLYVEGIRDSRRFLSGLRTAARMKPVVVVKAGRHAGGSRAALSHTGAMVGADDVFDAALARAGAVRAGTVEQLFAAAVLLAREHRVRGSRLAIVTNAGGPAVLAADRAEDLGVELAVPSAATLAQLDAVLPAQWSHGNPVDILGDAPPERFEAATRLCLGDNANDGVLVMLTPQAMTEPLAAAQAVIRAKAGTDRLLLACWMGERDVAPGRELLAAQGIPEFSSPETAVEAFGYLAGYQRNQQLLLQVPGPLARQRVPDIDGARRILQQAIAEHRSLLKTTEARAVLAAFGIPVQPAIAARGVDEALRAAESLGYPVALKINSPDITHKSDVNGVRLNVGNAAAVGAVYHELLESVRRSQPDARLEGVSVEAMYRGRGGRELHVGIARDAIFGPVVSFGLGGVAIEVLRDRAIALPPLNERIVRDLVRRTRASRLLGAFRNLPPIDMASLEQMLLAVSEMACELPELRELDMNPVVGDEHGVVALDVRIVTQEEAPGSDRYSHLAIHPYPTGLETRLQLQDGTAITIRPIRPEDAQMEARFVHNLSPQTKYFRFHQILKELTPPMLRRFTQIDYARELALIAVVNEAGGEVEIAVARYSTDPDAQSCDFAVVVADAWQGRGIATHLLKLLMQSARSMGLHRMTGEVLMENTAMLSLAKHLGFSAMRGAGPQATFLVCRELQGT